MLDSVAKLPLLLLILRVDVPVAPPIFNVPKAIPPPVNVLADVVVLVKFMVEDAPLNVRFVFVDVVQTVPVPLKLIVEVPNVSVLVFVFELEKEVQVTVLFPVSSVPLVNVIGLLPVKLSCKVHPPPTPLKTTEEPKFTPFVVIVFPVVVAAKVIVPDTLILKLAEGNVQFPKIDKLVIASVIAPSRASTPVPKLILLQTAEEAVTVNVPVPTLEFLSKITSSADVGTPAPPLPPEPLAQLVVDDAFQVPVPPTQ